jgi:hypothetical protein
MINKSFISLKVSSSIIKLFITVGVIILYIHYFFPQSWGFYTLEPKQPLYNIYIVHNGILNEKQLIRNNLSYGMGISMKGRILFSELYMIIDNKNLLWRPLIEDSLNYIIKHGNYISISTGNEYSAFKGNFLITKTVRPSYSDLKNGKKFYSSKYYILTNIR